jgi:peptidoglycan lytic transglycosylase G
VVEERRRLSAGGTRLHSKASRRRIAVRRATALLLIAGAAALLIWLGTLAYGAIAGGSGSPKRAVPPAPRGPMRIVFPEGFTRAQMAERITAVDGIARQTRHVSPRLSAPAYLAATATSTLPGRFAGDGGRRSLEGFLFPATYDFTRRTTSRRLVRNQLLAFARNWKQVNLRYARSKNLTRYDVLIIASMIEREVRAPSERRLVSAVIYNRLHDRMRLQIDAALRYGLHIPPARPITELELRSSNPYNTSTHYGLPPTPIANPGLASIQAAAHPAHVDYLYFVRRPDKVHHFFTNSLDAFNAYVAAHPVQG